MSGILTGIFKLRFFIGSEILERLDVATIRQIGNKEAIVPRDLATFGPTFGGQLFFAKKGIVQVYATSHDRVLRVVLEVEGVTGGSTTRSRVLYRVEVSSE